MESYLHNGISSKEYDSAKIAFLDCFHTSTMATKNLGILYVTHPFTLLSSLKVSAVVAVESLLSIGKSAPD